MKKLACVLVCFIIISTAFIAVGQVQNLTDGQIEFIQNLVLQGLLKLKPELNKAYIDPTLWASMDIDLKGDFTCALAIYCCNQKGTDLYWIDIYDLYSGKKLAKYSESWGFKVYK